MLLINSFQTAFRLDNRTEEVNNTHGHGIYPCPSKLPPGSDGYSATEGDLQRMTSLGMRLAYHPPQFSASHFGAGGSLSSLTGFSLCPTPLQRVIISLQRRDYTEAA